jgi:hypothetical protein
MKTKLFKQTIREDRTPRRALQNAIMRSIQVARLPCNNRKFWYVAADMWLC